MSVTISIHAPLAGCDHHPQHGQAVRAFQSTHPLRGATRPSNGKPSPLPISIHAPLAGCDPGLCKYNKRLQNFNPRTPCGVRPAAGIIPAVRWPFQSTHPLRGATRTPVREAPRRLFQSTHPLRGATAKIHKVSKLDTDFNPRTPCGVRHRKQKKSTILQQFQSTHPLRGATRNSCACCMTTRNFNPRTPCGVRPGIMQVQQAPAKFQSTHPLRGATGAIQTQCYDLAISIHAPLAGCDSKNRQISRIASVVFAIKQQILQQEPCNCKKRPGKSGSKAQFPRANRPGKSCTHPVRAKGSGHPLHHIRASRQSAQLWHGSPGCKTAGCPVPAP